MQRIVIMILTILMTGCANMEKSIVVSPSNAMYYEGNLYYEEKEFSKAIELYKKFLERAPHSDLAVPVKLNLGMSYYYSGDYENASETLKDIKIEDPGIKDFIKDICSICTAHAAELEAKERKTIRRRAAKGFPKFEPIRINIIDAYLDDFGSVILKGKIDRKAAVSVDGAAAEVNEQNEFTSSVSWKKGTSISIKAKDESGNANTLNYFPDTETPDEPEGLRTNNVTSNSAEIEWNANSEEDIRGYRLYYRLQGGSLHEINEIIEDTRHEIVGLNRLIRGDNKTIQFTVKAVDKMYNESDESDILEVDLP